MENVDSRDGAMSALVGRNVSLRRRAMGFSASYVASGVTRVGVPLSRSALSQVENGKRRVTVDELDALGAVLLCAPALLMSADPPYPGTRLPGDDVRPQSGSTGVVAVGTARTGSVSSPPFPPPEVQPPQVHSGTPLVVELSDSDSATATDEVEDLEQDTLSLEVVDTWNEYNRLGRQIEAAMAAFRRAQEHPTKYGPTPEQLATEVVQMHTRQMEIRRRMDELSARHQRNEDRHDG